MILRGGMNVYPREVEEVIYTAPRRPRGRGGRRAGRADGRAGRRRRRAARGRHGHPARTSSTFTKERIAAYKYPRKVWVVPELPKGPTGKILRREVHAPARSERLAAVPDAVRFPRARRAPRAPRRPLADAGPGAARACGRRCSSSPSRSGCASRSSPGRTPATAAWCGWSVRRSCSWPLGLLWWAWWSVRALRRGRREGWTLLLVLGGVSVVQAVLTARAVLAASTGTGGRPQHRATPRVRRRPAGRHRAGAGLRRRRRAGAAALGGGRRAAGPTRPTDDDRRVSDRG